jgi:DNA-directed RNA polymerase subunit RPC12/RpoP
MSSYPPNDSLIESPWTQEERDLTYRCHECGKETVRLVSNDLLLPGGIIVTDLERLQCGACGANLFDLAAMRRIREARSVLSKSRTRQANTRKHPEPTNA